MLFGKNGQILYGSRSWPLYASVPIVKLTVMTEWVFNQDSYGSPAVYINGEVVCPSHSTTHIIDYLVTPDDPEKHWDEPTKSYIFDFSMGITPSAGNAGGPCDFRCWDNRYGSYSSAPENARASSFSSAPATKFFRAQFFIESREWRFYPRG